MTAALPLLRRYPVFCWLLGLLVLVLVATVWWGYQSHSEMQAARQAMMRKQQEWHALTGEVQLAQDNAIERAERQALTERVLAQLHKQLRLESEAAKAWRATPPPPGRTESFFDLALMVEQLRELALAQSVQIRADERFGFAAYANAGPDKSQISTVYRQRLVARHLLEILLEVRPAELLAVQRERVGAQPTGQEPAAAMQDYFTLDPRLSVRDVDEINVVALRLIFMGHTSVLRAFLLRLSESDLPLLVRAVEVEPLVMPTIDKSHMVVDATERPFVSPGLSKFTVAVEYIERRSGGQMTP